MGCAGLRVYGNFASLSAGEKNLMLTGLTPESVQHLNTSKWSSVSSVANVSSVQLVLNT